MDPLQCVLAQFAALVLQPFWKEEKKKEKRVAAECGRMNTN